MGDSNEGWESGEVPWVRRQLRGDPFAADGYAQCYFCGQHTAKISVGDLSGDNGRVEIYCTNNECDVRVATVIVTRDGNHAGMRADVRILNAIDKDSHSTEWPQKTALSWREFLDKDSDDAGRVARRTGRAPITYAAPGYDEEGHGAPAPGLE